VDRISEDEEEAGCHMFNSTSPLVGNNPSILQAATTLERSSLTLHNGGGDGCLMNTSQCWNSNNGDYVNNAQNTESFETLMAKSYNETSPEERGEHVNELHGVSDEMPETSEMIDEHLSHMETELGNIEDKPAYNLALSLSPDYVMDRKFRLMFLRAERFDSRGSAMRMVRHFEEKLELFGRDLLTNDIVLSDLEDHEIEYFRCGRQQPLMLRDRSGRMISFVTRQHQTEQISITTRVSSFAWSVLCAFQAFDHSD
jgi:hypothetical protein